MTSPSFSIELSDEQVAILNSLLHDASESPKVKLRANVLLLSDVKRNKTVSVIGIAEALGTSRQTVIKIRNIYHEQGFDVALHELKRNRTADSKCYDNELIACVKRILSEPPMTNHQRWSIRLLCDECISRGYVESISPNTMHRLLRFNHIDI